MRIETLAKELENERKLDASRSVAERKAREAENAKKLEEVRKWKVKEFNFGFFS